MSKYEELISAAKVQATEGAAKEQIDRLALRNRWEQNVEVLRPLTAALYEFEKALQAQGLNLTGQAPTEYDRKSLKMIDPEVTFQIFDDAEPGRRGRPFAVKSTVSGVEVTAAGEVKLKNDYILASITTLSDTNVEKILSFAATDYFTLHAATSSR